MGTAYESRNDSSNNIADGNVINAADLDGEFDGLEGLDYAEKIYNKLNRVYRTDAKEANMSTPNYIMTYLVNK